MNETEPKTKRYIRVNMVEAEPMTAYEFDEFKNREHSGENCDGYKVVYDDGYVSWCPKARFEEVSREIDRMTFGMAIEAMKKGHKVARKGWNGKGMWLCIPLCDGPKEIPAADIWGKPNAEYAKQNGGKAKVVPYITMKAADGSIVMGWLASQTDMLSDDWVLVG